MFFTKVLESGKSMVSISKPIRRIIFVLVIDVDGLYGDVLLQPLVCDAGFNFLKIVGIEAAYSRLALFFDGFYLI